MLPHRQHVCYLLTYVFAFVSNAVKSYYIIVLGSHGNADGGSDTGGFVVATESVMNDEGYISILVNWKVRLNFCTEFAEHLH